MKRYLLWILVLILFNVLSGCAGLPASRDGVEEKSTIVESMERTRQADFAKSKQGVTVTDNIYVGRGKRVKLSKTEQLPKFLGRMITLVKMSPMTLQEIAEVITREIGVTVNVTTHGSTLQSSNLSIMPDVMYVSYSGTLQNFLDTVSANFGLTWEWKSSKGQICFYRLKTQTFSVAASLGKVDINTTITNLSDTGGSSSEEDGVSTQTSSGEQATKMSASYTAWEEIKENIKSMLSDQGRVVYSKGAGTVTVTDYPSVLTDVENYVTQLNDHLTRQVAISVRVYALRTDKSKDHGISIDAVFQDETINVVTKGAAALTEVGGLGQVAAAIIGGQAPKWTDSEVILKSLRQVGDATLLTSGHAITLNNQPSPIQVVEEQSYLAKVSSTSTTDVGTTSELTPGKVTTGFSMLAIPHVLDSKTVILQYSLNLSSLDSLDDISSGAQRIQVPTVSTRSVLQRVRMPLGSTLVLSGYEEQNDSFEDGRGLFGWQRKGGRNRNLIVIAITVNELQAS